MRRGEDDAVGRPQRRAGTAVRRGARARSGAGRVRVRVALGRRPHLRRLRAGASPRPPARPTRWPPPTAAPPSTWPSRCSAPARATRSSSPTTPSPPPATAVVWTGATPVFADVRADIGTIDPASVEALVTRAHRRRRSRSTWSASPPTTTSCAPSPTGTGSGCSRTPPARRAPIYQGRPAGSLADLATFSFHGRKGITSGEGGALVGDDDALMARARKLHTYGIAPAVSREGSRAGRAQSSTTPASTTGCPTCRRRSCASSSSGCPSCSRRARAAADGYAERLDGVDGITLPGGARRPHPSLAVLPAHHRRRASTATRWWWRCASAGSAATSAPTPATSSPSTARPSDCPVSARLFQHAARAADARQPRRRRPRLRRRPAARGAQVVRGPAAAAP